MRKYFLAVVFYLLSAAAHAAPFCVVTANGTNCWYYGADTCQAAARAANGACVPNTNEDGNRGGGSSYQSSPSRSGAPFCVQTSYGVDCWYYDMSSCRNAARSKNGLCVINPDR